MTAKYENQRVGVFVDVANMYHSARSLYNARVNFGSILKTAVMGRLLVRAITYVVRAESEQEQDFFDALVAQGYEVKSKELQTFVSGAKKGDWDVGLCMDAVRLQSKLDVTVLVSGDGDFAELMAYLKAHGQRVELISFGRTTSGKLLELVDDFIDMDKLPSRFLIRPARPRTIPQRPIRQLYPRPTAAPVPVAPQSAGGAKVDAPAG